MDSRVEKGPGLSGGEGVLTGVLTVKPSEGTWDVTGKSKSRKHGHTMGILTTATA